MMMKMKRTMSRPDDSGPCCTLCIIHASFYAFYSMIYFSGKKNAGRLARPAESPVYINSAP